MEVLKWYVVLLSLFATTLACDLKQTDAEIDAKAAVESFINTAKESIITRYRLLYHVAPTVGWMNDPNGFSFFKNNYHLFYQYHPQDIVTGPIHWGHVVSKDLVTWTQLPVALLPEDELCFSGSAIVLDGTLVLMYTAHKEYSATDYNETQYLAFSNDGVVFNKYKKKNPVISFSPDSSKDFRDPKVWKHENYYYVVLGSQTSENLGRVLLYRSSDMAYWEYLSEVAKSNGDLGYMWECPDFFELNGSYVLLMSPQGIPAANRTGDRFQNDYQTGYIIGNFNYATGRFVETVPFQEIDYGHDFYATQTQEKDGKRYLIAWMGSWDGAYPERADGWAGAMTIIRELTLRGDRILMKPVDAITSLRGAAPVFNETLAATATSIISLNKTGELIVDFNLAQNLSLTIKGANDAQLVVLKWTVSTGKISLERINGTVSELRQGLWNPVSVHTLRIFLDASSIEVFCGEGEVVFSSRVYPDGGWRVTNSGTQTPNIVAYELKRSVPE